MLEKQVETVNDIEMNSTEALELLADRYVLNYIAVLLLPCNVCCAETSVRCIPRASRLTGPDDPSGMKEVKELAHQKVHQKYLDMVDSYEDDDSS
jgi:hypothetical protein